MSFVNMIRTVRARLRKVARDHPLVSNTVLYGGLYTLAEISQQKMRANLAISPTMPGAGFGSSTSNLTANVPASITAHDANSAKSMKPNGDLGHHESVGAKTLTSSPSHHRLDMSSVKRYAIMGTFVIPPILTKWYNWLDNRFPSTSKSTVVKKLILDQFLLTPWLLAMFFIGMAYLEGEKGEQLLDELRLKFGTTFTLDCCYWLPVQALNFLFVPPVFRVVYIGVTTFIWMNILCYIKASPH